MCSLNIAQNKMASRVQQALASVARESEGDGGPPSVPKASVDPALKGVPEALLEKVPLPCAYVPSSVQRFDKLHKRIQHVQGIFS